MNSTTRGYYSVIEGLLVTLTFLRARLYISSPQPPASSSQFFSSQRYAYVPDSSVCRITHTVATTPTSRGRRCIHPSFPSRTTPFQYALSHTTLSHGMNSVRHVQKKQCVASGKKKMKPLLRKSQRRSVCFLFAATRVSSMHDFSITHIYILGGLS